MAALVTAVHDTSVVVVAAAAAAVGVVVVEAVASLAYCSGASVVASAAVVVAVVVVDGGDTGCDSDCYGVGDDTRDYSTIHRHCLLDLYRLLNQSYAMVERLL